jgi:cysteinyl-tRNA synthetase
MLKIFNTLGRKKEEFVPLNKDEVTFYQCGPTVYWIQHIGNMRAMVLADLISRSMEYLGYKVKFARNYTDVGHLAGDEDEGEDKLEKGAKREGLTPQAIADKYIAQFEADVKALNCEEPTYKPRATDYIPQMAEMVQDLIDKGFAYATDLAIYFDVEKYIAASRNYTELSGQKLEKNIIEAGKGEVADKYKKSAMDFSIWFFKAGAHKDALQTWEHEFKGIDQPIKFGFPGWHLECSAMNKTLFGPTIDLHMGGIEHIPVHHTNEIAQSEAASGIKFVDFWLHNEHLTVDGVKMSKSGGTAYSVADIIAKGYDLLALRYFFLQAHYRSKQNFTWEALDAASSALDNLRSQLSAMKKESVVFVSIDGIHKQKFTSAIEDDFNLPQALAVLWDVLKSNLSDAGKYATILDFDKALGLNLSEVLEIEIPAKVKNLAEERKKARINKNWTESDRLRDEINKLGWQIKDAKNGYEFKKNRRS